MDFTTANKTVNLQIAREYKSLLKLSYQTLSESDKVLIRKALDILLLMLIVIKLENQEKHIFFTLFLLQKLLRLK